MEDDEEEDKGEELDRTVVVNDSPTKSFSKADDEENATKKKKSFTPINATMNERMKKLFSKENAFEKFAKNAKETTFKAGNLLQDVSSKSFVKMKESVQKMKELSATKKNADENENDDDAKAKKRVERGIRASTTETNNNADIFLDVEDDLRFLGYADGDHATLAKVTVMKWSVMFPRCLAVGREDGTIRVIVFGSKNGMDNRAKNKKKEKNKETKEATSEKRAATNDSQQQQKEEEEEGNEKKQHKKGGSVADRVASIEKEQKQEEGRDGASTPPPPTTEIILSDDEDEEKMDEYNAHGVSHVFELEDVFTEAVSDLDWSLDGSALLACSAKGKEIRMYKLNDNNSGNTNNATKYFRSGTLEAVVQISENPTSVKIHPVRTNLALITTKQRSVMLADVNSSQPPDRVRVQGDPEAGLKEICFNTSGRLAYFGDDTGRVFTLSCIERKDFTKKLSISKLLNKGKKSSNNSSLAKQTDPTSRRIKEEKNKNDLRRSNSSSGDMASKGGEGDDGGGGDHAAENNDNNNNNNDNNNGIKGETSESPAAPAAKKSLMSALKPEEIKEKAKEKANLMAKRMKDDVKVAMNRVKTYAKEKATKPSQGFSLTVLHVNSLGQERSPVCALFWCAYVASINAPVLAVATANGKIRLLRIVDLGTSGDHLMPIATASMPSQGGGFSFCPAKVSTAPPMVASPRDKVTGLVCEILQTKNSLSQNEEGQDERNYEIKQVLETREDDTFFSDGEDETKQDKPKTPALAFCADSFSFSSDGLRLAGSNANGKVAIWTSFAM
ncbi:unnamed protein product [Bathycoccus prasinos]|jgi:hypothetical protein